MVNTRRQCAIDQSVAGHSAPRQPVTEERQAMEDQQEAEPQIPLSPLPSDDKVPFEIVQSKVRKYKELIEELQEQKKGNKGKQKDQNDNGIQTSRKKISYIHDEVLNSMLRVMERCRVRGFVYGMVPEIGKPLSGASDSLRGYWKKHAMFEKNAPGQIDQFKAENSLVSPMSLRNDPRSTFEMLMELSNPILGSILSFLMQHCSPKQRQFPLHKGVPPPWWPTTNESWWDQTGIPRVEGPPPYRKTHDLKKKWKAAVLLAVIKHMSPEFHKFYDVSNQYKYLMDRMRANEKKYWKLALIEEAKPFCSPSEPLHIKFSFLSREVGNNSGHIIYGGMVTESGFSSHGQTNPTGYVHEPPFVPSSSNYTIWPATMPQVTELQQGVQMSSCALNTLIAGGTSAPEPPSFATSSTSQFLTWPMAMAMQDQSQQRLQMSVLQSAVGEALSRSAPVPSGVQGSDQTINWNGSVFQDPCATSYHQTVVAPCVGDPTIGMQVQNQPHDSTVGGTNDAESW